MLDCSTAEVKPEYKKTSNEDYFLLGYDAMYFGMNVLILQRIVLLPSPKYMPDMDDTGSTDNGSNRFKWFNVYGAGSKIPEAMVYEHKGRSSTQKTAQFFYFKEV